MSEQKQPQNQNLLVSGDNVYPIITQTPLVKAFGMASAAFLQKLFYFLVKNKNKTITHMGKQYWYHTYLEWVEDIGFYSLSTIKRVVKKLANEGIIIIKKFDAKVGNTQNYYAINEQKLKERLNSEQDEIQGKSSQAKTKPIQVTEVSQATPQPQATAKPVQVTKVPKPLVQPITVQQATELQGTSQPTIPHAQPVEILAMPQEQKRFYELLRQNKVDISHTDPRLNQLLKHHAQVLPLITYLKRDGFHRYQWHTPEQLQLDKLAG